MLAAICGGQNKKLDGFPFIDCDYTFVGFTSSLVVYTLYLML